MIREVQYFLLFFLHGNQIYFNKYLKKLANKTLTKLIEL